MKCAKCNVEVEAMLYKKHPKDKQRYVVFICPKCKNAILTDIKGDLLEADIKEN
jgi:Zn finger protein HypA/HybF involved in hydrogenase expression